jgi:nucleoside-diphosphate-sugar epimerase
MKLMILGSAGFLGSWTARAALAAGHEVIAVHREASDPWRLAGLPVQRLALDASGWPELIAQATPDAIVSLDWEGVSSSKRDDDAVQASNLARQKAVLASAIDTGVSRLIGVGSQAEYGPLNTRVTESMVPHPDTAYGRAKVEALRAWQVRSAQSPVSLVWARIFSVYGPLEGEGSVLSSIADAIAGGRTIALGEARLGWSYLYAADAASALIELATHPSVSGVYNVGHPEDPPLRDSLERFADRLHGRAFLAFGAAGPGRPFRLAADMSRLEKLGWRPRVDLGDGLAMTADWMSGELVRDPFDSQRMIPPRPSTRREVRAPT